MRDNGQQLDVALCVAPRRWAISRALPRRERCRAALMIEGLLDAVIFDIGGTVVQERAPGTPVCDLAPQLLPRVAEDLAHLSRFVRIAAATNTSVMTERDVRGLLDLAGVDQYFLVLVTSCDVGSSKPEPTQLIVAMERLEIDDPDRVLFVGDRDSDEMAARAAGIPFAYVSVDGLRATVLEWAKRQIATGGTVGTDTSEWNT